MPAKSSIEWTQHSWNPVTGCSKVSPGCAHCYAERLSLMRGWSPRPWTPENAVENVQLHADRLGWPLRRRKPTVVFVNSMSDLFHELVPFAFVDAIVELMAACPQHVFQVLTKRPQRIREYLAWQRQQGGREGFTPNIWLGTSIENRRYLERADYLRTLPVAVRFISAEPLLAPLVPSGYEPTSRWPYRWELPSGELEFSDNAGLDLTGIDWLIAGGESGPGHRPMRADWVRDLRDLCVEEGIAFFFKQWGGRTPKSGGRELDGRTWDELPERVEAQATLELEPSA